MKRHTIILTNIVIIAALAGCSAIIDTESYTFGAANDADTHTGAEPITDTGTIGPFDTADTLTSDSDTAEGTASDSETAPSTDSPTDSDIDTATEAPTDSASEEIVDTIEDTGSDTVEPVDSTSASDVPTDDTGTETASQADWATDTDTETASQTDWPTDTDTPSESLPLCDGWVDKDHNLCWQRDYSEVRLHLDESPGFCADRGEGWRVPTIDELRMLIVGCAPTSFLPEYAPVEPVCGINHFSEEAAGDHDCGGCEAGRGPTNGCYWQPVFGGECLALEDTEPDDDSNTEGLFEPMGFWSASPEFRDDPTNRRFAWIVDYNTGEVSLRYNSAQAYQYVRCVQNLPEL